MKSFINSLFVPFLGVIVFISLLACDKEPINTRSGNQINLQSPAINQENLYLKYDGECGQLTPTGDTLKLKIVGLNGSEVQLNESFTPGSPEFAIKPDPHVFGTIWSEDYLVTTHQVRVGSSFFYQGCPDTLWLRKPISLDVEQNECSVYNEADLFEGRETGIIPSFQVAGQTYLQKRIVSIAQLAVPIDITWNDYMVFDSNTIYASFFYDRRDTLAIPVRAFTLLELE